MKTQRPNVLARALRDYFADHLPRVRGMSPNTVRSYRDSFTLLLRFVAAHTQRPVIVLDVDDLDADQVIAFLQHLEDVRGNSPATRNVRLAAIHAFFRYFASRFPDRLDQCQRVLGIPFKRAGSKPVEYLEFEELQAIFNIIDQTTTLGRRDYALIATMFNTGARVQEALDLRPCDVQFIRPYHARLFGKGRKERLCPLWPQTACLLRDLLAEYGTDPKSQAPLFRNRRGDPLTRFGVRYILTKHCDRARATIRTLANKRLHPHSIRHSTAIQLLKADVDLVTISHWLGHASVNTTNRYAKVDLEMKRDAINKIAPVDTTMTAPSWRTDTSILAWLESL